MDKPAKAELDDLCHFIDTFGSMLAGSNQTEASYQRSLIEGLPERDRSDTTNRLFERLKSRYKVDVVETTSNGRVPTEKGIELWKKARKLVEDYRNLSDEVERNTVYISTIDAGAHFWIPQAVKKLGQHPQINLCVQVRQWWDVLRDVRNGMADFGIATDYPDDVLEKKLLLARQHRLVVPKKHKLAKKKHVEIKELADETVICMQNASGPVAIEHRLLKHDVKARVIVLDTASQILTWITQGLGIGFLPDEMIPDSLAWCTVPQMVEAVDCVYLKKNASLSAEAQLVMEWILKHWNPDH